MMNLNYIMKKWMTIGLTAMLLTSSFPVNVFAAEAEIPETELTGEVQTESEDEASVSEETADFEQFGAADDGKNMAGAEEDSWKSIFEAAGYEVTCVLDGLGQLSTIQQLFVAHAAKAMAS